MLAQEARWQLGLDGVLLMPTRVAPHKEIADDPGVEARTGLALRAVERSAPSAVETLGGIGVSDIELRRDGPSYAVDTIEELRRQMPDAAIVWLLGADAALGFGAWKRAERIAELAALGVAERDGVEWSRVEEELAQVGFRPIDDTSDGSTGGRVDLAPGTAVPIEMPRIGISSSMIRERVRDGRPIRHLVPGAVADLIAERGLYGG